jgi:hypothetical protein
MIGGAKMLGADEQSKVSTASSRGQLDPQRDQSHFLDAMNT